MDFEHYVPSLMLVLVSSTAVQLHRTYTKHGSRISTPTLKTNAMTLMLKSPDISPNTTPRKQLIKLLLIYPQIWFVVRDRLSWRNFPRKSYQ